MELLLFRHDVAGDLHSAAPHRGAHNFPLFAELAVIECIRLSPGLFTRISIFWTSQFWLARRNLTKCFPVSKHYSV